MINDRYIIKRKLGSGKNHVYLCSDLFNTSKNIAIRILPTAATEKESELFRKEFFLLKKLKHPNIVSVYDYGTILKYEEEGDAYYADIKTGCKFITADYVEGVTLDKYEFGDDPQKIKVLLEQICSVLFYLHKSNYVYYNLRSESILVQATSKTPRIYLYNFTLTKFIPDNEPFEVQGMPQYIAPEILEIKQVDHRADLYALGILLYYLIYNRFPFKTDNELNIYKANIENNFEFPHKNTFEKLIDITKALLRKSPDERYDTSLQILKELQIPISDKFKNEWKPVKTFCCRNEEVYNINSIIYKKDAKEVVAVRGSEGSGKSYILEELNYNHINSILIKNSDVVPNINVWKVILRKLFYTSFVYQNIDNALASEIQELFVNDSKELTEKLKSIFLRISRHNKFVLLLDDFNSYDELSIELLKEIIPILQVNGAKTILAENSDKPTHSDYINNLIVFHLQAFSEENLNDFIEKSHFKLFPKSLLKNCVIGNSNLLPGNIYKLIDDFIQLEFIHFDYDNIITIDKTKSFEFFYKNPHEFYALLLYDLSTEEMKLLNLCSLFELRLDLKSISILCEFDEAKTESILSTLICRGIFNSDNILKSAKFSSLGLKNFVYHNIASKQELHLYVANKIFESIPSFNKIECARQFEIAGKHKRAYAVLKSELKSAAAQSNIAYQNKLLARLRTFNINPDELFEINYFLSDVLFKIGDFSSCIILTNNILENNFNVDLKTRLLIQKGQCLIKLNKANEGITLLNSLLPDINNQDEKQKINVALAQVLLDSANYASAKDVCKSIIEEKSSPDADKAKAYSLIAQIEQEKENNLAGAIYNLQYALNLYKKENLTSNIALMEMNIGNIIYLKGNLVEAEKHWNASFKTNEATGNLSHEAILLQKFGKLSFNAQLFEIAIEQYRRAENIYSSLGDTLNQAVALSNLGEVYLNICEYELSLTALKSAQHIFESCNNEKNATNLFLFGQCYFQIGDFSNLENIINTYQKTFSKHILSDKHKNNIKFLKVLLLFGVENYSEAIQAIKPVIKHFGNQTSQDNLLYYAKSNFILIRTLINLTYCYEATDLLNESTFQKICESNPILNAEREYLLGLIYELIDKSKNKSEPKHLERGLKLIENQKVLELTWEINFALAKFYFERDNYKQFSEYSLITKSLINFILGKISTNEMRAKYLKSFGRKFIIETLEQYEKLIYKL